MTFITAGNDIWHFLKPQPEDTLRGSEDYMNFNALTKRPFKERMKNTAYLLRNSFTVIGKDEDIKTPIIRMAVWTVITRLLFFASLLPILTASLHQNIGLIALSVLFWIFMLVVIVPLRFFYDTRQRGNVCWIVFNTICGKDISYTDAVKHTKGAKKTLRILGLSDLVIRYAKMFNKESGFLINLLLGFLEEVWDLISNFLIPAVLIESKPVKEIVPDLKSLKNNVPATLTGVFGIDFAGGAVKSLIWGISFLLIIISAAAGWLLTFVTSFGTITFAGNAPFSINWIPVFLTVMLVSILLGIASRLVESIKIIYFTIFYTSVQKPDQLSEDIKEELTGYLNFGESKA